MVEQSHIVSVPGMTLRRTALTGLPTLLAFTVQSTQAEPFPNRE